MAISRIWLLWLIGKEYSKKANVTEEKFLENLSNTLNQTWLIFGML